MHTYTHTSSPGDHQCLFCDGALLLFLLALEPGHALASVYVSGQVISGGRPVPDVAITLRTPDADPDNPASVTQSLPNGAFVLRAPGPGPYLLTTESEAYIPGRVRLEVPASGTASVVIQLERRPHIHALLLGPDGKPVTTGTVEGWILLIPTGDASVQHRDREAKRAARKGVILAAASPSGEVDLTPRWNELPRGPASIQLIIRAAPAGCAQLSLPEWPASAVTVHLQPGATLAGVVRDQNGKPVVGAPVAAAPVDLQDDLPILPRGKVNEITDSNGHFEIHALFPGQYRVRTQVNGRKIVSNTVSLTNSRAEISIGPGGR